MDNLILHLNKEYFDQISRGEKVEEYRLDNPYWQKRFEGRRYEQIILLCGYPKRGDSTRQITLPWRGCECKLITYPYFGNKPISVFAIKLR
jgi:hypothetical protein